MPWPSGRSHGKKEKANSLPGRDEVGGRGHSSHKGMLMRKPSVFWAGEPDPCDCSGIWCHKIGGDLMGKSCWSQITEGTECQPWGPGPDAPGTRAHRSPLSRAGIMQLDNLGGHLWTE